MYHCDDCGREGTPRMLGRVLVCYCGSLELRWLPSPASPAASPPTSFDRFINDALTLAGIDSETR